MSDLATRLWSRLQTQENGCRTFTGYCHPKRGYGQIGRGARREGLVETHRLAWELTHGPIPVGMVVRHRCDNPPCCNPDHLELGTQADNAADMVSRGRQARGSALPQTRLSDEQVRSIRAAVAAGTRQRLVAEQHGITQGHVSSICSGRYRKAVA